MTPLYTADKYTYRVLWSASDRRFVGVCTEFPALSYRGDTMIRALNGIMEFVRDELAELVANRQAPPVPLAVQKFNKDVVR